MTTFADIVADARTESSPCGCAKCEAAAILADPRLAEKVLAGIRAAGPYADEATKVAAIIRSLGAIDEH